MIGRLGCMGTQNSVSAIGQSVARIHWLHSKKLKEIGHSLFPKVPFDKITRISDQVERNKHGFLSTSSYILNSLFIIVK
jgi:hypothetical protein